MSILQAILIAIIEGLTEFLPISSTGHMVIASSLMGIADDPFTKFYEVAIQLGAIMSVVVLYWKRFFQSLDFYFKLFVAFLPAAVFGVLLGDYIDSVLENPITIAVVMVLGGVVLLFVDKWFLKNEELPQTAETSYLTALKIGLFQVLAIVFPGLSRSAATIIGGLSQGLNRQRAAEFAFFLAVPTMAAATLKKAYDFYKETPTPISSEQITILAIGNIVAFVVALIAIRTFIGFLNKNGFRLFGYYRIIVGLIILGLVAAGVPLFVH